MPSSKGYKRNYGSNRITTEYQYALISGNWSRYLSRLIYAGGKKREHLTVEILMGILEDQDYKCALSGLPLTCQLEKGKKFPFNVSIDRVEPGGPYTKENIQLVGRSLNSWRADTKVEDFIFICRAVADYNKEN
jgi:hypothetical protein